MPVWAATPPAGAEKPAPPKLETVGRSHAEGVLGEPVLDAKGQTIGHVVNVLIDSDGTPQAAVIEFAGFFGLGNRDVAVDWKALRFAVQKGKILIHVMLEPGALKAMPEYKPASSSVPVATRARREVPGANAPASNAPAGGTPAGGAPPGGAPPGGAPPGNGKSP